MLLRSLLLVAIVAPSLSHAGSGLSGTVKVDGSSTVFPITEAVAEEFGKEHRKVRVTVGVSGTGGGFKKFCAGEIDINDASRTIKDKEVKLCKKNGIEFLRFAVAYDGISVVINPKNTWAKSMTVAELKKIWEPGSQVKRWSQVRKGFPDRKIRLYGPGTDSGTFDYFTKAINGKSHASRSDFTKSEDDNVLVRGVAGDRDALGFFGFAYYSENRKKLTAVAIQDKGSKRAVKPSMATINDGSYSPLSRPVFIYLNTASTKKPHVLAFIRYYLKQAGSLVKDVGYVPLKNSEYAQNSVELEKAVAKNLARKN